MMNGLKIIIIIIILFPKFIWSICIQKINRTCNWISLETCSSKKYSKNILIIIIISINPSLFRNNAFVFHVFVFSDIYSSSHASYLFFAFFGWLLLYCVCYPLIDWLMFEMISLSQSQTGLLQYPWTSSVSNLDSRIFDNVRFNDLTLSNI